jgi:hypothetical protein
MKTYLKYVGNGRWLLDVPVPARDLTKEEADKFGVELLVNSGLYERVEKERPERADAKGDK